MLLATSASGLKQMLERFKKYSKRKGLELNTEKTKIMIFRNGGRRKREVKFEWNGEEIEVVKKFEYLGYTLKGNGKEGEQIRKVKGKANALLSTVWEIGETLFKDNWKMRMKLFDTLVQSVMEYGAEIWCWKEQGELEKVQRRYMKWVLKLERTTPAHVIHWETKRFKLETRARKRAVRYEGKLRRAKVNSLLGECWRLLKKEGEEGDWKGRGKDVRRIELGKCGISMRDYIRRIEEGEGAAEKIERINKDTQ